MKSLRETLIDKNLDRIADHIESTAKKSVRMLADKPSTDATNRLGGRPNLPNVEWPTWREEPLVPDLQDQTLAGLGMTPEEREAYFDLQMSLEDTTSIHRVGGFPQCIQGDPKLEAHLVSHGLYCDDPSGYKTGKKRGLWPGATEWELLLQLDSEERANMMWGDVGRIYFLIHKSALARRQFDKTWVVLQCS